MQRTKKIVIAMSILLGIVVYFYVMFVCLMHESPYETVSSSDKLVAETSVQEKVTTPKEPIIIPVSSRPESRQLPQITRNSTPQQAQNPFIGKRAPDFELLDLDGRQVKLSYFKDKLIILDFWATWCGPCVKEIPHFIDLYEKYADRGLVVLGVSVDRKGINIVDSFVKQHKINYQILMADTQVKAAYGGIRSIPTTFIIDKEGKICRRYVGYRDKAVFEADIKALLVSDDSLIADLDGDDPSVQLVAIESLIARGTFPEPDVFLKFCNSVVESASLDLDMSVRVHAVVVQYLSRTRLNLEDLICLKDLPSPRSLEFDKKPITDTAMAYIGKIGSLRSLSLRYSKITDTGLTDLQGLASLQALRLEGTKITDEGLAHLKDLSSLAVLFLGGTQVTDAGLRYIENLTNLERFCLHHARITNEGMSHLKNLRHLKYLCIHSTKVSDAGMEYLKDMRNLETLHLHNTQVTDEGLVFLEDLSLLRNLTLAGTNVTGKGVDKLRQKLQTCNISFPPPSK